MPIRPAPGNQAGLTQEEAGYDLPDVSQEGHGIAVDAVVYNDEGVWTLADASTAALAGVGHQIGIVYAVGSVDLLSVRLKGVHTTDEAHALTNGAEVYLSETAGEWTEIAPDTALSVVVKLGTARGTHVIDVDIDTGYTVE